MLLSTLRPLAILSLALIPSVHSASTCAAITCDAVHFFLARGNNEPYPGRQGALVAATCAGLLSCGYEDLVYSALYTDLSCQSTYDGAIAGHVQMAAYAAACPDAKLVLAGYSQGAQIVMDILGGGGGVSFNGCVQPDVPALDRGTKPGSMVAAALVFGNTRHTANQGYNFGNGSAIDGLFPRSSAQLAGLQAYASVIRDWCVSTDPICAANQANSQVAAHLGYFNIYASAGGEWIRSVASLSTVAGAGVTSIPGSRSGIVQDYATIGTATPSGTVTLDASWTAATSVVACTGSVSSSSSAGTASSTSSVGSSSKTASSTSTSLSGISSSSSTSTNQTASTSITAVSSHTTSASSVGTSSTSAASSTSTGGAADMLETSIFTISVVITVFICL